MQIIIDIPKEMWERVKEGYVPLGISKHLRNGTPLPKGHGDLIDRTEFAEWVVTKSRDKLMYTYYLDALNTQNVIIKADTESEE